MFIFEIQKFSFVVYYIDFTLLFVLISPLKKELVVHRQTVIYNIRTLSVNIKFGGKS